MDFAGADFVLAFLSKGGDPMRHTDDAGYDPAVLIAKNQKWREKI